MQPLDHAAVDLHHALVAVLRLIERRDHLAGHRDLVGGGREHRVARLDLVGVNQRLAVEAEIAALQAFALEAVEIREVVVDAVDDVEPVGVGGQHAVGEPAGHRGAARHDADPALLGEIVGAHHEAAEPGLGVGGGRR